MEYLYFVFAVFLCCMLAVFFQKTAMTILGMDNLPKELHGFSLGRLAAYRFRIYFLNHDVDEVAKDYRRNS